MYHLSSKNEYKNNSQRGTGVPLAKLFRRWYNIFGLKLYHLRRCYSKIVLGSCLLYGQGVCRFLLVAGAGFNIGINEKNIIIISNHWKRKCAVGGVFILYNVKDPVLLRGLHIINLYLLLMPLGRYWGNIYFLFVYYRLYYARSQWKYSILYVKLLKNIQFFHLFINFFHINFW